MYFKSSLCFIHRISRRTNLFLSINPCNVLSRDITSRCTGAVIRSKISFASSRRRIKRRSKLQHGNRTVHNRLDHQSHRKHFLAGDRNTSSSLALGGLVGEIMLRKTGRCRILGPTLVLPLDDSKLDSVTIDRRIY